jgi:SAM-dependent methyltransferase
MTLAEQERAQGFGASANEYDRLRPDPPEAAIDWLIEQPCERAVELGAGTGRLSRILTQRIPQLYAIEPDPRMREVCQTVCPGITLLPGTAEDVPLEPVSVDGAFVMNAWHWFDPDRTSAELARVLRPGGRLGVLWNEFDVDQGAGWVREVFGVVANHQPDRRPGDFRLPATAPFEPPEQLVLQWTTPKAPADLVGLLGTYSAVLAMSPTDRDGLLARTRELIDTHPDLAGKTTIDLPYRSICWRTRRTAN